MERPVRTVPADYEPLKEKISRLIKKEMGKKDVVGLSVALVDGQRIVWTRGFGWSDKKNKIPATPDTVYRVGSISKLFTAVAVMQLAERGKMDVDKPLKTYLPEFSVKTSFDGGSVTPRNLMTHHSGLSANYLKGMWTRNPSPLSGLPDLIKSERAAYPPDHVFSYSNLGVSLLGAAVQMVAGRDFAEHMEKEVLGPLGMTRSAFSTRLEPSVANSKGYRDEKEADDPSLRDVPAGGLNASAVDLSRFMRMILVGGSSGGKEILRPATVEEMLRPQNENVPLDFSFRVGLGWMLSGAGDMEIKNAGPVAHHAGGTILFHSQLIILPRHELGVVVLANSDSAREAVDKIATETIKLALEAKTGIKQSEKEKDVETGGALPPEKALDFEGDYATIVGLARITNKNGSLNADAVGRKFRLVQRADGLLGLRYRLFGFIPIPIGTLNEIGLSRVNVGNAELLTAKLGGLELLAGAKIKRGRPSQKWLDRLGGYEIVNAEGDAEELIPANVRLVNDGGLFAIKYSTPLMKKEEVKFAVNPISDDEGVLYGIAGGEGMGERVSVETINDREAVRFSGYLFRKKYK